MKATLPAFAPGCIALCSRGLVQSRTMEACTRIIKAYPTWDIRYTHSDPIPAAQNNIVAEILSMIPQQQWILFIEEDNVPPWDVLKYFDADHQVQAVDYRLRNNVKAIRVDEGGKVLFSGMGCLLIRASIFRKLAPPLFRTREFTFRGGRLELSGGITAYGGQDIDLSYRLQEEGIPIRKIEGIEADHLFVKQFGQPGTNDGCHQIEAH